MKDVVKAEGSISQKINVQFIVHFGQGKYSFILDTSWKSFVYFNIICTWIGVWVYKIIGKYVLFQV